MSMRLFWALLTVACVVWYSTITVYVAIRGALDIKHMLKRLGDEQDSGDALGATAGLSSSAETREGKPPVAPDISIGSDR